MGGDKRWNVIGRGEMEWGRGRWERDGPRWEEG